MIKSIGANWIQLAASIGVTYYLTPFVLHRLGTDQYGTWLLITALTGYLGLLVLGLPMATVRFVAKHARDADPTELNRAIANCLGICAALSVLAIAAGLVAFAFFASYPIAAGQWPAARIAFVIVVANTAAGFIGQLPIGILAAHEEFVTQNKILLSSLLLRFAVTLVLLRISPSLPMLAASLSLSVLFELLAGAAIIRAKYPHIRPSFAAINWSTTREIFGFSLYVLLLAAGSQLSFQTDAIIVGKLFGVNSIPFFSTASLIAIYVMHLVIGIGSVVMPTAARMHAGGGIESLREVFLKWSKICLSLTLLASIFLVLVGPQFLGWWLGDAFVGPGGSILRILTIGNIIFLPARGVALPILMGIGNPRLPAIGFVIAGVVNLGLSIVLGKYYGLAGVAIGTSIPNAIFAVALIRSVCRTLNVSPVKYVSYVTIRPVIGAIVTAAVLYFVLPMLGLQHFIGLFSAGIIMLAVFSVVWMFFVYRNDEYVDVSTIARSLQLRRG